MAIQMKQSMELRQTLRMTPQLQQAIKLLQLSRLELEAAVRKELEENPILEEGLEVPNSETQADAANSDQATNDQQDPQKQDEFDWENYVDNNYKPAQSGGSGNEEIMNYENVILQGTQDGLGIYKRYGFQPYTIYYEYA